ncbi:S41 family peptidase [Caenispirillum salinarum]|uniref:S41 family peptidase n=1 Tax=Caenispirillum salinarum TaxID=859058 RepID=UPI00384ACD27
MSIRKKLSRPASGLHRAVLLVAALTAAACAPSEGPRPAGAAGPVSAAIPAASARPAAAFPNHDAERVFAYGFSAITGRYINDVSAGDLALEGLRGLGGIDPALIADTTADGRVELRATGGVVASRPAPATDDARAWARAVADMVADARRVSPPLAAADSEAVYQAVFDSALSSLDMFSRYAGAEEARDHRANRNGFGGIGIRYVRDDAGLEVRDVFDEAPSSGLLFVGDVITAVNGIDLGGLETTQVKKMLRGPIDSTLTLTVSRPGIAQPVRVPIRRDLVVPRTVTLATEGDSAIIRISSFNQRTAESVQKAVAQARAELGPNLRGLVLDLRGNPGGLLDQAVEVSDLFIDDGPILSTRGRHPESRQYYNARHGDIAAGLPMVVLVDGRSASSAEIVSAALQDQGRAVVVGTTSYGKGTVQTVVRLPNDGEMTLTWSRFHSPSGYALHGLGVMPSLCTAYGNIGDGSDAVALADASAALMAEEGETDASEGGFINATHTDAASDGNELGRSVEQLLRAQADVDAMVPTQYAQWRSTPLEDTEGRRKLRTNCPPKSHAGNEVDLALGERLVREPALYRWALGLTADHVTARR